MPISSEPYVFAGGSTPAYFAGLLPEGPRLVAMSKRINKPVHDQLGILLEIGADLIGDVRVLSPNADPSAEREVLKLASQPQELDFEQIRKDVFGATASGLPGVQDKVSSRMLSAPAKTAGIDYMLKLNPTNIKHAVENEHFFLKLAAKCQIPTADFTLLIDKHGEHALRLKRFDRLWLNKTTHPLAAEDGAQVLGVHPSEKYDVDFLDIAKKFIEMCPAREVAALALFKQLVFNWLIGNGDAHAKNFSVLETLGGEWRIAPAYDLLCTRFYDDRDMALPLNGETSGWSRAQLLDAAAKMGLPEAAAARAINKQLEVLADLPEVILSGALPFARHLNIDVAGFLKKRAKAIG